MKKHWYDYLWIVSPIYLTLGFFNIIYAWIGLIFFYLYSLRSLKEIKCIATDIATVASFYPYSVKKLKLSRYRDTPSWMKSKAFRYAFLAFFLVMFANMLYVTYLVMTGVKDGGSFIKLFWTFKVPWPFAIDPTITPWVNQFALGFYSLMLTSTLIGVIVMILYKPRTWCSFCPMGTMTQTICAIKAKEKL